ncbi:MAG: flagellar export protein FliJ [Spirochaetota bacterium]
MKRFYFRLENVLRVRKKVEEGVEKEFSRRKAQLLRIEAEINELGRKLRSFIQENGNMDGVFSAAEMVAVDNYISRIEHSIKRLKERHRQMEEEVQRYLKLLLDAKKARKTIENLKERQINIYNEESSREEGIEIDDVNQNISRNQEKLTIETPPLEEF